MTTQRFKIIAYKLVTTVVLSPTGERYGFSSPGCSAGPNKLAQPLFFITEAFAVVGISATENPTCKSLEEPVDVVRSRSQNDVVGFWKNS